MEDVKIVLVGREMSGRIDTPDTAASVHIIGKLLALAIY